MEGTTRGLTARPGASARKPCPAALVKNPCRSFFDITRHHVEGLTAASLHDGEVVQASAHFILTRANAQRVPGDAFRLAALKIRAKSG